MSNFSFHKIPNLPQEGFKLGRYAGTYYWNVRGFGKTKWVVLGYIDCDWVSEKNNGKSEQDIVSECLQTLNSKTKIVKDKKTKKDIVKPIYGFLEVLKIDFKFKNIDGVKKPILIGEFITNERTNPYFWGEGQETLGRL